MKHCFYIVAHKSPELVGKIVKNISAKEHYIYIHIDKKVKEYDSFRQSVISRLDDSELTRVTFTKRYHVNWGGFSMSQLDLRMFRMLLEDSHNFDYIHKISGQDYPCVCMAEFDDFFINNNGRSYMKLGTIETATKYRKKKFKDRLEHFYLQDVLNPKFRDSIMIKAANKLVHWIPRPYKEMDKIFGGWSWYSLHRSVVKWILNYCDTHEEYVNRFKFTNCSDELIFSTILKPMVSYLNIDDDNSLHYVDFHPVRPSPQVPLVLEESEYEDILDSKMFFCRKVELGKSDKLIEMLDSKIELDKANYFSKAKWVN